SMPHSRPMPSIGRRCHELRIDDENVTWRIVYRIDSDAIVILEVFEKKTNQTPKQVIDSCKQRIKNYA
ncbi:MAG: type II toxin-antitoxin system RelE/ParE family toxin, partial [Nostocaceae cyanobacterium CSU_2_110]|nr:type II toxin-antitoxin system RelE/ParE family toxin [Nostocaceae cyanobacterium CSU_2_110]